jgi:hypothetical protein
VGDVRARLVRRLPLAILITGVLSASTAASAQALTVSTTDARTGVIAATVFGEVGTADLPTVWAFEYGPTTQYGQWSTFGAILPGSGTELVAAYLSNLTPRTTYHYRLVATPATTSPLDATEQTVGSDKTFTTQPEQLHLDSPALSARSGAVQIPLQCESSKTCNAVLVLRTKRVGRHASTTCTSVSVSLAPWLDQTLAPDLSNGCQKLLKSARGHRVSATLSARLSSGQLGFSLPVLLSR